MRQQLDAIATLIDQGAADSAVRLLRSSWEPELPPEQRVPIYCMWVRGLCETGDLEHALTLARRAAEEFPRDSDVLTALGNVLDLHGFLEEARDAFAVAIDVEPNSVLASYNLGAVLERLGEEDEAEACYRRAIELDENIPSMVEASSALGAILRRHGRLEEAEAIYDRYLDEDPLAVEILVEHGICLSDLERLSDAIERFDAALALQPEHATCWYNKAITLYRMGEYQKAKEAMTAAYASDTRNPLTLAVLGSWQLSEQGSDLDEALGYLYRAIEILEEENQHGELDLSYSSLVVEEVFESLWQNGKPQEAREVARFAGQRDWMTPHMFDTLNHVDHGSTERSAIFKIAARAQAQDQVEQPEHWPRDAEGYTTDLTVVAESEDDARKLAMEYLAQLEPAAGLCFDLRIVDRSTESEGSPRAIGVARIESSRSYFHSSAQP